MNRRLNLIVIFIGLILAFGLCTLIAAIINGVRPNGTTLAASTAVLTVIPAPTQTPSPPAEAEATITPTGGVEEGGIATGMYVQISGTGGDGLKMRSGPGMQNDTLFLGMEAEVYLVKDGPKEADGYTWWLLEAPYDSTRKGWAASKYLTVVASPH